MEAPMKPDGITNKDLERFKLLRNAYLQQKKRITALLEYDVKSIGTTVASKNLDLSINYFYKVFRGESISYDALIDLYLRVQDLKKILGVKGAEDK